jgi:hypothetical protein
MNDHNLAEILVPIVLFGVVAAIAITPMIRRSRERMAAIEAIRSLSEKGQATPPELMMVLQQTHRPRPPGGNLRAGVICLAIAGAMLILALSKYAFSTEADAHLNGSLIGASAFPGLIGLALVGLWSANRRKPLDD